MSLRLASLLTAAALLASGCENYDWPPFEQQLLEFFAEHKSSLEELEHEMAADGYRRMNARILSGAMSHPVAPAIDEDTAAKYRRLLDRGDRELSVVRYRDATEFEMLTRPVGTSLYLFRYVRDTADGAPSECEASMREDPCGKCSIELGGDWRLEYDWFPQDLDEEARKCQ